MRKWLIAAILSLVSAKKQAVYSSNYTTAYLLTGDDLYSLVLSGETESVDTLSKELKQIQVPESTEANLAIDANDNLYALFGGSGCDSTINIQRYNSTSNLWTTLTASSDGWYHSNGTAWYDSTSNSILVYGGLYCNSTISRDFYKYDISSDSWSTATANPMPREMAYGQTIATSKDATMIVGGRTNDGWLSMQQVAIWQYNGWSYWPVGNYTGIDSRDDPFLLPMWNNSKSSVSAVLVLGGTVAGREASPSSLSLKFSSSNGWYWDTSDVPASNLMLSVYNSVYSYSNSEIYGASGQVEKSASPQSLTAAQENDKDSKKGLNVGSIAALSTIIPLFFIILGGVAAWMWWRKRKQRTVFLPRQSQIMSPNQSLDMDNFPDFYYPPVRSRENKRLLREDGPGHGKENSHSEYEQNDIQFLVNKSSRNLRVVNPDLQDASSLSAVSTLSSVGTLSSEGGALLKTDGHDLHDEQEEDWESVRSDVTASEIGSFYHHHRSNPSRDLTEMQGANSSRSSSRATSMAHPKQRNVSHSTFDFGQ